MANASVQPITDASRPAGLVSMDGRTYPLKSANIAARAEGGIAATTLTQTYSNPYEEPLEVLYTLPLPANGAVVGYTVRIGKRIIQGEIQRRAEAQEEYRKALFEGRAAALLEQDRADTFTQKLGSLPPGETAQVDIKVLQPLDFLPTDGKKPAQWEYRFPTVVGVRYEGAPGRVRDAEKLDVDRADGAGTPARLEASLLVADGPASVVHPHAPGLKTNLEDSDGAVRVVLEEKMKLDRDLVIRWTAVQQKVGVSLIEGKGLPRDMGRYALLTLTPPAAVQSSFSRDLTLLIDASGSMSGIPISRAKMVAEQLLRSLDAGDRFEILAFANDVRRLVPGPMEVSAKNIREAISKIDELQAGGGTEMTRALVEALKPLRINSQRQVILLSDGYIGFEGEVIGKILSRLVPGARLHTVGIGSAANRTLTRGAARAGRGIEVLVGDDDDAQLASRRLLRATVRPVLTELEVSGSALVELAPQRPQDVLEGQPLVLVANISPRGGQLIIQGKQAGTPEPWVRKLEIPAALSKSRIAQKEVESLPQTSIPLGALFGREAIEDLELQLASSGRSSEIEEKIETLGLEHRIASRMTSLVAISKDRTVNPKDPRRRERLPVELPAEISAEGAGLMPRAGDLLHIAMMATEPKLSKLPGSLRASRLRMRPRPPRRINITDSRVLKLDGQILIFEFEVPVTGFVLPHSGMTIRVHFHDGTESAAHILGSESSEPGPHHAGHTVRLALKLEDHHCWNHNEAQLRWGGEINLLGKEPEVVPVHLHIALGARF